MHLIDNGHIMMCHMSFAVGRGQFDRLTPSNEIKARFTTETALIQNDSNLKR